MEIARCRPRGGMYFFKVMDERPRAAHAAASMSARRVRAEVRLSKGGRMGMMYFLALGDGEREMVREERVREWRVALRAVKEERWCVWRR